ncbi:MAG: hypothetical protein QNJ12_17140 [Ilumatobacter sp.]|uniref:hypothetical protein n=1 Tax=Ilumatobacter sp. TaxID=1967498 RepID=UPI00262914FF|nr:hypothetical protein [Ilumatobacter sp.]MDJ0770522.1 hypothetical protein [Ilumatobacter sp.]
MALVETDGGLHVVDVVRFGPSLTELDDQQAVWDRVIGRVAPTMTPALDASALDEEGIAPHADLRRGEHGDPHTTSHAGRGDRRRRGRAAGGMRGGPNKNRSRGDR